MERKPLAWPSTFAAGESSISRTNEPTKRVESPKMLFKIHYFIFNAGLSGVLVLLTVFLRRYSDASSTEVGTLLMVLPFVAVFTKPLFCALADRHRKYRLYFILSLAVTLLGFGPYALVPFFPSLLAEHGRLSWYLLVVCTVVGYIAYGVAWSLGDACAANVSLKSGESFGLIRLWGTIGWGVAGAFVGLASPHLQLPEMVLGLLVFVVVFVLEIGLLWWWPDERVFEMGGAGWEPSERRPSAAQNPIQPLQEIVLKGGQLNIGRTNSNSLTITAKIKLDNKEGLSTGSLGGLVAKERELEQCDHLQRERRRLDRERVSELQTTILKMVALKHKSLFKYLLIFVALGAVYNVHWSFFFLHLERLAGEPGGADFSSLVGACLVAQAVGETFCFMVAPWVVRKLGRDGTISLNALAYALRYFGNGLGIPLLSPYVAILTESLQGINYGIFYYLVTDTALHYARLVEELVPELLERKLIEKSQVELVSSSLRATMQGLFSGAFDGLGFGLGSLVAGLLLERHAFEELWCFTGAAALTIFMLHALYELTNQLLRVHLRRKRARKLNKISDLIYSTKHLESLPAGGL